MLAADAPWWAGEFGSLPHAAGDNRPAFGPGNKPTGANASNYSQPTYATTKAPDMSAYKNATFTPPQGARANDLSGQVPANQMWAQAYNQASNQYGGNTQAQSWTMPGAYTSQSYNPTTGQYGTPTTGQSWDGNLAYNAMDNRPGPITATATGIGGNQMGWQDTLTQRDAFAGNLINRLNQYNGGQLTGAPTFNTNSLLSQANDQLSKGTYYNPFAQQNPTVQQAMGNANQYMQGTQWQNPFGNSPAANNPTPSWSQPSYSPYAAQSLDTAPAQDMPGLGSEQQWRRNLGGSWADPEAQDRYRQAGIERGYQYNPQPYDLGRDVYMHPGAAQPKPPQSQGTPYNSAPLTQEQKDQEKEQAVKRNTERVQALQRFRPRVQPVANLRSRRR